MVKILSKILIVMLLFMAMLSSVMATDFVCNEMGMRFDLGSGEHNVIIQDGCEMDLNLRQVRDDTIINMIPEVNDQFNAFYFLMIEQEGTELNINFPAPANSQLSLGEIMQIEVMNFMGSGVVNIGFDAVGDYGYNYGQILGNFNFMQDPTQFNINNRPSSTLWLGWHTVNAVLNGNQNGRYEINQVSSPITIGNVDSGSTMEFWKTSQVYDTTNKLISVGTYDIDNNNINFITRAGNVQLSGASSNIVHHNNFNFLDKIVFNNIKLNTGVTTDYYLNTFKFSDADAVNNFYFKYGTSDGDLNKQMIDGHYVGNRWLDNLGNNLFTCSATTTTLLDPETGKYFNVCDTKVPIYSGTYTIYDYIITEYDITLEPVFSEAITLDYSNTSIVNYDYLSTAPLEEPTEIEELFIFNATLGDFQLSSTIFDGDRNLTGPYNTTLPEYNTYKIIVSLFANNLTTVGESEEFIYPIPQNPVFDLNLSFTKNYDTLFYEYLSDEQYFTVYETEELWKFNETNSSWFLYETIFDGDRNSTLPFTYQLVEEGLYKFVVTLSANGFTLVEESSEFNFIFIVEEESSSTFTGTTTYTITTGTGSSGVTSESVSIPETITQAFSFFNEEGNFDVSEVESIESATGIPYSDVATGVLSLGGIGYAMRNVKFSKGKSKKAKKSNLIRKSITVILLSGFIYIISLIGINSFM